MFQRSEIYFMTQVLYFDKIFVLMLKIQTKYYKSKTIFFGFSVETTITVFNIGTFPYGHFFNQNLLRPKLCQ